MRFFHYRTTNSFGSFCCPSIKLTVWPLLVFQPPLGTVPQFEIVIPAPDCGLLYGNIKATLMLSAIPVHSCGHELLNRDRDLLDVARVSNHLRPEG